MFKQGSSVFAFDLKSAYHHIEIFEDHTKFLAFKWLFPDGSCRYFEFQVLPFGLSTAHYVFTKVMRQLVKFWRSRGLMIVLFLDDGMGRCLSEEEAVIVSGIVLHDLKDSGFTINDEKSRWKPNQIL